MYSDIDGLFSEPILVRLPLNGMITILELLNLNFLQKEKDTYYILASDVRTIIETNINLGETVAFEFAPIRFVFQTWYQAQLFEYIYNNIHEGDEVGNNYERVHKEIANHRFNFN
jgi:hypothetical protein